MTERPIPFRDWEVRAILDGRKTQTRRVMKPVKAKKPKRWLIDDAAVNGLVCPYGQPGDTLWVREAWRAPSQFDDWPPSRIPPVLARQGVPGVEVQYIADAVAPWASRYRHTRFMPRWASRITLRITDVRVERLQDITQKDAIAEGAPESHPDIDRISRRFGYQDFSRSWFAQTWENINGPGAWESNPWVWAISFERVKP